MKAKLKVIIIGLFIPTFIYCQTSNTEQSYLRDINNTDRTMQALFNQLINSYASSLNSGFSESSLSSQINYCDNFKVQSEKLSKGTIMAHKDTNLAIQIKNLYEKIDTSNIKLQKALDSFHSIAEGMISNNCFTEKSNCDFISKKNNLELSLQIIIGAVNTIHFNSSFTDMLSNPSLFQNQTLDEVFSPKEKLRFFINENVKLFFYDALFPDEDFTFRWSGDFTEIEGKNLIDGDGILEFLQNGVPVCTYEGNIQNGRLMDTYAKLSYTDFKPDLENKLRVLSHFIIESFFYNKPIGNFKIESRYGKYTGEHQNYIPNGLGTLEYGEYLCEGEFKGGIPYNTDCKPQWFSKKEPFKIINGNVQNK